MAKDHKMLEVEANLFEMGMEDGYACYPVFSDRLIGYFYKDGLMPKSARKPAIKTRNGWREVEVGKHYIITGLDGYRFVMDKDEFESISGMELTEKEKLLKRVLMGIISIESDGAKSYEEIIEEADKLIRFARML
ncbi:hypothetical protein NUG13_12080 [Bacillus subtilis]|uniref:Uncharacterized protein n=1 Tax=Bacillus phage vB_BsuS_PJN02 TaxID=2920374 RepID=A0AC61TS20_9CAUD|nr:MULTISPECIES: hypothetical protein [Bacillus subtilis group]YP_010681761.1 hypothetical protein PQE76_gp143 [Bacillus phage vB_BsuS_PJN02]MCR4362067.1 hypothetical protein [Bacillus subtilis]UNH58486.1 hypothetical protein [Bacillus phage vB_BsuS_PJN02]UQB84319.1 hypothetical protein KMZ31_19550 [Bacillus amyloliquefaciens]WOF32954.1 hypothetical protein OEJ84_22785 [Bacillus subtilis]